jgi:hypothetical protein
MVCQQCWKRPTKKNENIFEVRFEDLTKPKQMVATWQNLFDFLNIGFDTKFLTNVADIKLAGKLGDPSRFSPEANGIYSPNYKWKKVFANPLRKRWIKRYLNWIGNERISRMGYRWGDLLEEINSNDDNMLHQMTSDFLQMIWVKMIDILEPYIYRDKLRDLKKKKKIVVHR